MTAGTAPAAVQPRREDRGDLIVLHLYGSYREMGRQQVELLGPLARELYEVQRADWYGLIKDIGLAAKLADLIFPRFWTSLWSRYEKSGYYEEINGMADALKVSGADCWRGVLGALGSGSTVFLATGTATADGRAIVGRNVDWSDRYGLRCPLVTHYHPTNGDLAHVMVTWPFLGFPIVGLNEAGFTLSMNFFAADQILGLGLPQWPWRRALQHATSVEEGIHTFTESRNRGLSGFAAMADASGDIAMVECAPSECAVFRPDEPSFAHSNHARTAKMILHDRGRHPDTFRRRAAMEDAVRPHLGKITPEIAARIIRDRSNSPYVNESTVANTGVINAVVVHPASKILWHSTTKQPLAPFGKMVPFSVSVDVSNTPPLPADPHLGTLEMEHEAAVIGDVRRAVRLFDQGKVEEAGVIWERFAENAEPILEPHRLAWARARVRWTLGRLEDADALLAGLDTDEVPFDIRAHALVARALIADRAGRRDDAMRLYRRAQAYLDAHPDYNHQFIVEPLRSRVSAGLRAPQIKGSMPEMPDLQGVPS